jgi:hypothetical protein
MTQVIFPTIVHRQIISVIIHCIPIPVGQKFTYTKLTVPVNSCLYLCFAAGGTGALHKMDGSMIYTVPCEKVFSLLELCNLLPYFRLQT